MASNHTPTNSPPEWTIGELLQATGGALLSGDENACFTGIAIDSRKMETDRLFVAIRGENHDGHRFVADLLDKGHRGFMVRPQSLPAGVRGKMIRRQAVCLAVADTTRALGDVAAFRRRQSEVLIAAITGSNGKTTTRRMAVAVASQRQAVLTAPGNFNNEIGVPLTLLALTPRHRWGIIELGMNHFGEIRRLAEICAPQLGLITNVAPAHLEGVGSLEGVKRAKGELIEQIAKGGTAILNADDRRVAELAQTAECDCLMFGISANADVRGDTIRPIAGGTRFDLHLPSARTEINLQVPGRFMVSNALAAAALGYKLGLSVDEIKAGLESFRATSGRMEVIETARRLHIINDTYNANPESMRAAIETLNRLRGSKRGLVVLGDMLELGEESPAFHREVGDFCGRNPVDRLYVTGEYADEVAAGAIEAGIDRSTVFTGSKQDLIADLETEVNPGDWILVKGSRGMAMEEIVNHLKTKIPERG